MATTATNETGDSLPEEDSAEQNRVVELFELFCKADSFKDIVTTFRELCDILEINPCDHRSFLRRLRSQLQFWQAKHLWLKLERRSNQDVYVRGNACSKLKVLIVGAGPCGLRMAIECALLGAKVVVVEKRTAFSRHNVLHLWPFLIKDLQHLGVKKFYPKFCVGSVDHISIRRLQCMLLKVGLLMGIEVHAGVEFSSLVEPEPNHGWTASLIPEGHPLEHFEFDVIVGADGRTKSLPGFKRKEFRGKLAIAITANFVNYHTNAERQVPEISGVSQIFKQEFFKTIKTHTEIDLENLVYYKDDTHYFVMTARKSSLLTLGVLKQDINDPQLLLRQDNVDQDALLEFAKAAADFSTAYQLPRLDFATTHRGEADVAMFDFTCRYGAESASRVIERRGRKLLTLLVGDSLLEPFWPMGTGCARGFLAVFDAAWMMKRWSSASFDPLTIIAERESLYQLLSQTTPENTGRDYQKYSIDPATRYPNLNSSFFDPKTMTSLYESDTPSQATELVMMKPLALSIYEQTIIANQLFKWCRQKLSKYTSICKINDLSSSWSNGVALGCLLHLLDADLMDPIFLLGKQSEENVAKVLKAFQEHYRIYAGFTANELAEGLMDPTALVDYLLEIFEEFRKVTGIVAKERKGSVRYADAPKSTGSENVARSRRKHKRKRDKADPTEFARQRLDNLISGQSQFTDEEPRWKREPGRLNEKLVNKISDAFSGKTDRDRELRAILSSIEHDGQVDAELVEKWELNDCSNARGLPKPLHQPEWDIEKGITEARRKEITTFLSQGLEQPEPTKLPDDIQKTSGSTKRMIDLLTYPKEDATVPPLPASDDRYQLSKVAKDNIENFETGSERRRSYQEFDERIKATRKLLEKGNLGNLGVGVKGQNKVTQLSKRLITDFHPSASVFTKRTDRPIVTNQSFSDFCFFCRHKVLLPRDKGMAEGFYFHKSCFRCAACDRQIATDRYIFVRLEEKFYCVAHGQNLCSPRTLSDKESDFKRASLRVSRDSQRSFASQSADESDLSDSSTDEFSESGDNEYSSDDDDAKTRKSSLPKPTPIPLMSPTKEPKARRSSSFADQITKRAIVTARENFFCKTPEPVRLDPFAIFCGPKSPEVDSKPFLSSSKSVEVALPEPSSSAPRGEERDSSFDHLVEDYNNNRNASNEQTNQNNSDDIAEPDTIEDVVEQPLDFGDVDFIDDDISFATPPPPKLPIVTEPETSAVDSTDVAAASEVDIVSPNETNHDELFVPPSNLVRLASAESVGDSDLSLPKRNSSDRSRNDSSISNISAELDISPDELEDKPNDTGDRDSTLTNKGNKASRESSVYEYRFRSDSDPGPRIKRDMSDLRQPANEPETKADAAHASQQDEQISQNGIGSDHDDDVPGITFDDIDFADDEDDSVAIEQPAEKLNLAKKVYSPDNLRKIMEEKRQKRAQQAKEVSWMGRPPPVDDTL